MNEKIDDHFKRLKDLKSKNSQLGKNLEMKCNELNGIFDDMDLEQESTQVMLNVEKIKDSSKHINNMIVQQNKIVQDSYSLTEEILGSLRTLSTNMEIIRYRDWIKKLINKIIIKLNDSEGRGGTDTWKIIKDAFDTKIKRNRVNFKKDSKSYIDRLKTILNEVDISIEEFEVLMKLKSDSNSKVHKGSQTIVDANNQLETFPENIKGPLRKTLAALDIWDEDDDD